MFRIERSAPALPGAPIGRLPSRLGSVLARCGGPRGRSRTARAKRTGLGRAALLSVLLAASPGYALAAETVSLTLKNHRFTPDRVSVPAGVRFRIEVSNQDDTPAEFESHGLKVEKVVAPGGRITVMAGPLKPGTYKFFDDYHQDTAVGFLTAVAKAK